MHCNLRRLSLASLMAAAAVSATWVSPGNVHAVSIPIVNSNFETDAAADPEGTNGGPTGWSPGVGSFGTVVNSAGVGVYDPGDAGGTPAGAAFAGENNFAYINLLGGAGDNSYGNLVQDVATTVLPSTRYTLTVDVGHRGGNAFPSVTNAYSFGSVPSDNPGSNILTRLYESGTNTPLANFATVTSNASTVAEGTVKTYTIVYETGANVTPGTNPISIQLFAVNDGTDGVKQVLFDNVTLDVSPVPEPTSLGLLAAGGFLLRRRRR